MLLIQEPMPDNMLYICKECGTLFWDKSFFSDNYRCAGGSEYTNKPGIHYIPKDLSTLVKTDLSVEDFCMLQDYYWKYSMSFDTKHPERNVYSWFDQYLVHKYIPDFDWECYTYNYGRETDIYNPELIDYSRFEKSLKEQLAVPIPEPKHTYTPPPQKPKLPVGLKCPYCESTDLTKLSVLGKAAKVGLFGIFGAGSLGKTWKCNNCGSKF